MITLPSWVKLNKNWVPAEPYIEENWIVVDIFRETKTRKQRVSSYKQIFQEDSLLIDGLLEHLITYCKDGKHHVINGPSSKCITSASRRFNMTGEQILKQYFQSGYLGIETIYKRDGLSIDTVRYGTTEKTLNCAQDAINTIAQSNVEWLRKTQNQLERIVAIIGNNPSPEQQKIIEFVGNIIDRCCCHDNVTLSPELPWKYNSNQLPGNFHKALEFLISLLYCMEEACAFDWKEIGSCIDRSIGASKKFDNIKDQLLNLLESITHKEPDQLGIISMGSLYPLYLCGPITMDCKTTQCSIDSNTIYCLSNIQLQDIEGVQMRASRVIFTENRAVLLKMYKTNWIQDSNSLVICIDGNLKTTHKTLFQGLGKYAYTIPFYIWVDGDKAGRAIAQSLYDITPTAKLVGIQNTRLQIFHGLHEWLENKEYHNREQENIMGGIVEWNELFLGG
jgi:hypothetical protein